MPQILLKGNYKSFTKILITKSKKKSSNILINFHGVYGLSGDPRSKSKKLSEEVAKRGLAHAVNFNSSRDWDIYEDENWEAMKEAYKGKTFDQELADAKDTLDIILDQSKFLFKIDRVDINFFFVGNSLGGVVATCLNDYFKQTKKIVVAGSGTRTVMESTIDEKEILKRASKFTGEVMLLQGSKDDVVPLEAGDALLAGYKKAKTIKHTIEGANHQFFKHHRTYRDEVIGFLK